MKRTLEELAALLQGEMKGPPDLPIEGIAALEEAGPREISFVTQKRFARLVSRSQAVAFIVAPELADLPRPLIIVPHPYLAYARVAALFAPARRRWPGVSEQACLGRELTLGRDVSIAPLVFIGDRVRLDDGVTVMPGCYLGDEVHLGAGTLIYPNVTILERCRLGRNCIVHSGTVIGGRWERPGLAAGSRLTTWCIWPTMLQWVNTPCWWPRWGCPGPPNWGSG